MYKSLQAGRGVAAMLVVLYHLGGSISADKYFGIEMFSIPFSFGGSGVEFFFVLSGFIILAAHRKDISKPGNVLIYIKKRLVRVYPVYWFVFLPVFFMAIITPGLSNTVPHDLLVIVKSLLLVPQDRNVVGGSGAPVLGVAWTLQYEMVFYLFFALVILNKWLAVIVGFIFLFIYVTYSGTSSEGYLLSFFSKDFIWLFFMGMFVSIIHNSNNVVICRPAFYFYSGLVLFLLISIDIVTKYNFISNQKILLYGLASSLMIFGLVKIEDAGRVIGGNRFFQVLGDSSYVLYLVHYPIISVLCKFILFFHIDDFGVAGALASYITIFFICLLSAIVFHLYVEKPMLMKLRKIF